MDVANGQKPISGQPPASGSSGVDKGKDWQMELLMEKLRSKASTFKSLVETAKNLRMAMLDKRFAIDSAEKSQLQKCLDTLQHSIKVTSLQSMVERLESLTRQLGLKFMMSGPPGTELFISSDMFFLEVLLEPTGVVKDVKIHHEGKNEQQSCDVLVSCLSRGDFLDFTVQLEGLTSIYQLNADKKVKCKAFSALQSLEADLGILAQLQTFMKEPFNLVHKSPVGILERRRGGHAMKLTYFVSPYDLIDQENRSCDALSSEIVIKRKIGHSVTVCMEGSTAHKLPTSSIITVNRSTTGKSTPSYAALTGTNSSALPACFVLKLAKKMPMCMELVRRIQKVTELECANISSPHPLLSLIVQHASDSQLDCRNNRGLYVTLPDQQHCYFMTENRSMEGVLVSSIPFTHPAHVPQILVFLRQQALFNTLIASCVRPMARQDPEHATIFEVSSLSWQHISVSLEHPFEETMATAELDLTDISALKCKLYGISITNTEQTSDLTGKVLQKCLSIPLTMRILMKSWESRDSLTTMNNLNSGNGSYNVNLGSGKDQNNQNGSGMPDFTNGEAKIKQEPGLNNGNGAMGRQQQSSQQQQQQSFLDAGTENSIGFPSYSGQSDTTTTAMLNPLQLGALLGQAKNSMSNPMNERTKKTRKRKTADGIWRSPKRKADENAEILLESSSSDSTPLGTPTGGRENLNETRTSTPTSATSLTSGLDFSNLDPTDILGTDKSSDYDIDNESEITEVHDLQDVEELIKRERKSRKREEKKSPIIFEENKTLVPPSVSITPISSSSLGQTTNYNSVLTGMGLERRPGIEIIPIASSPQTTLPSSITITPIAGPTQSKGLTDDRRERKSSKGKSTEDKGKLEKRRKRKREDSPMGPPPDKIPSKQDPLSKPVSVSIKPTESPPNLSSRPSSPATTLRKFSPSPTHPLALVGKSSPTLKQSTNKPVQSPKHSPVYSSSPKHTPVPASVSPKHGTSSPKHGSSASTGKPSMSALKSAANSPSSKTADSGQSKMKSSSSSSSKDSNREKEKKTSSLAFGGSSGHQSPKTKSSSGKLKQLELIPSGETQTAVTSSGGSTPPSGNSELGKSAIAQQQAKNRKSSLSAVIDKLKNAQHCTDDGGNGGAKSTSGGSGNSTGQKERNVGSSSNKIVEGKCISKNSSMDTKNPAEYILKHSSDGMKITINKTRTKDSKSGTNIKLSSSSTNVATGTSTSSSTSSGSMSGNGSPKTHTGLKPGVSSGPASKKPASQTSPKLSGSSSGSGSGSTNKTTLLGQKMLPTLKSTSGSNSGSGNGAGAINVASGGSSGMLSKGIMSSKSSSSSPKTTSSGVTDLSRNRDKSRLSKSSEKSIFPSKGIGDTRKSSPSGLREESESERAFKLLAAHASMSNLSNLPNLSSQLVVEGFMKQLDTKFQIPKLSARANADSSEKKSDKLSMMPDSGKVLDNLGSKQTTEPTGKLQTNTSTAVSKPTLDDQTNQGRRDHVQTKPDNLSMSGAASVINLGTDSASNLLLPALSSSSSHDMDIPTNLSMQSTENESRDKEPPMNRSNTQFLSSSLNSTATSKDDSSGSGPGMTVLPKGSDVQTTTKPCVYPTMITTGTITSGNGMTTASSGNGSSESLNLSIKPVDAAMTKYKSDEKKQQQQQSQQQQQQQSQPLQQQQQQSQQQALQSQQQSQQQPQVSSSGGASVSSSMGTSASSDVPPGAIKAPGTEIMSTASQEAAEMLLDFSTPKDVAKSLNFTSIPERAMTQAASVRRNTPPPPPPAFPASPSVSVHIVKSPAPSPRVIPPSPHSASPCITDDELMDEALVGMGK
ncbi:mediator of RNA polymerase II transcription subunit 1-like [Ceratina calcarata]|uniref:Mediator of RNA polymerase II transcription subunit 1 n=1 Tax=Ceratina calcarata TaxID=156304 RepID=A0AAJ7IZI8_9HYME|nr:mediator of RNA polymerase II transcription subunit 1-like [Ceratina calcarata]